MGRARTEPDGVRRTVRMADPERDGRHRARVLLRWISEVALLGIRLVHNRRSPVDPVRATASERRGAVHRRPPSARAPVRGVGASPRDVLSARPFRAEAALAAHPGRLGDARRDSNRAWPRLLRTMADRPDRVRQLAGRRRLDPARAGTSCGAARDHSLSHPEQSVLLYDQDCGFCRWSLDKILAWDRAKRWRRSSPAT